jgi:hypothetical protein
VGSFPGGKADHSPSTSVEFKNAWSYTSIRQHVFMAWCLIKYKDNFTLTLPLPDSRTMGVRHPSVLAHCELEKWLMYDYLYELT